MSQEEERESEVRESNGNNDERYTQVDNDVAFNPIEGYQEKKEEEKEENPEIIKENEKDNKTAGKAKKEIKKLKIILLGEIGVGKSSLINRYVHNKYSAFNQTSIGAEKSKKVELDKNLTIDLSISDTTEEEKLGKFTKNYFLDAHGAIIVFDLTSQESFQKLQYWLDELNSNAPRDCIVCLLGNKADLTADRKVKYEDLKSFAGDNLYYEVSAKTGNNVSLAFEQLLYGIVEKQKEEENNPDKVLRGKEGRKTTDLNEINKEQKKKNKCC
jgi:small GTP-binding protein